MVFENDDDDAELVRWLREGDKVGLRRFRFSFRLKEHMKEISTISTFAFDNST